MILLTFPFCPFQQWFRPFYLLVCYNHFIYLLLLLYWTSMYLLDQLRIRRIKCLSSFNPFLMLFSLGQSEFLSYITSHHPWKLILALLAGQVYCWWILCFYLSKKAFFPLLNGNITAYRIPSRLMFLSFVEYFEFSLQYLLAYVVSNKKLMEFIFICR